MLSVWQPARTRAKPARSLSMESRNLLPVVGNVALDFILNVPTLQKMIKIISLREVFQPTRATTVLHPQERTEMTKLL